MFIFFLLVKSNTKFRLEPLHRLYSLLIDPFVWLNFEQAATASDQIPLLNYAVTSYFRLLADELCNDNEEILLIFRANCGNQ